MSAECPSHPDGHECEKTGEHTLHRFKAEWQFITWGEPESVDRFIKKKKTRATPTAELVESVHRITGMVRPTDPQTSHDAALNATYSLEGNRHLALSSHATAPSGMTDFELASVTGVQQTSIGKRRLELVEMGLIEPTDRVRPAPSGSDSMVWKITDAGIQALALV